MSITLYREIIVGIRLKISELPLPIRNDKYVPYINGHKNECLHLIEEIKTKIGISCRKSQIAMWVVSYYF